MDLKQNLENSCKNQSEYASLDPNQLVSTNIYADLSLNNPNCEVEDEMYVCFDENEKHTNETNHYTSVTQDQQSEIYTALNK